VAYARVAVGVHYPSDVLAGATIGVAVALLFYLTPFRGIFARIAGACSGLWERILDLTPLGSRA